MPVLIFFGLIVPTHWLLIGLILSVVALLVAVGGVVRHVLQQHKVRGEESTASDVEESPELDSRLK